MNITKVCYWLYSLEYFDLKREQDQEEEFF